LFRDKLASYASFQTSLHRDWIGLNSSRRSPFQRRLAIHHTVASNYHTKRSPVWYHYTFVVGFAMLIGVAWEFHEYIFDQTINVWYNLSQSQLSLGDTMKDFLMDWLGATTAFLALKQQL